MANVMPALFFGRGNPMNALLGNSYTEARATIGRDVTRPKAIIAVSAHWFVPQTGVTISTADNS